MCVCFNVSIQLAWGGGSFLCLHIVEIQSSEEEKGRKKKRRRERNRKEMREIKIVKER